MTSTILAFRLWLLTVLIFSVCLLVYMMFSGVRDVLDPHYPPASALP